MKRIVFVNLHGNEKFMRTMDRIIFKRSCSPKHRYLLDYLLNSNDYEVCSYINEKGCTGITQTISILIKILKPFRFIESKYVMKKNNIDVDKITILKKVTDIKDNDLILLYSCDNNQFVDCDKMQGYKAVSLLHFSGDLNTSNLLKKANINIMYSESNLKNNSQIFKINYSWYDGEIITHPFVYAERFKNLKPYAERKNKAVAMGTIIYRNFDNFVEIYGDECVQPLRKMLYDNRYKMRDYYDSFISDYNEDTEFKKINSSDIFLVKMYKKIYNKLFTGQQKKYFSFDMVEKYNEYKMCIVPEEVTNIPGIGFVEGMACGCAYIGLDSPMYTDLGLIPGIHYITYDGSKEDLKRVIKYYQADEHQKELEKIANAGYRFVQENFNGQKVAKQLIDNLIVKKGI